MLKLPFTSDPWRQFSTVLSGTEYSFSTRYNERNGVWYFDLGLESTGEVLAAGVPILIGCDMLAPYALGIGSLYAYDMGAESATEAEGVFQKSVDAGAEDLGTRVVVLYVAPGESLA